jgi:hypothetical protein
MDYQLLNAILHGQMLSEPRSWFFIAAAIAVGIAGWYCGDVLCDVAHKKGEE